MKDVCMHKYEHKAFADMLNVVVLEKLIWQYIVTYSWPIDRYEAEPTQWQNKFEKKCDNNAAQNISAKELTVFINT